MARTHKKNKKPGKGVKIALLTLLSLLLALGLLAGVAAVNASIVRIRRAEVELADLPPAFDGVRILYASDIDLCGLNTAERSGQLFERLQSLSPDMLILGGDYTSSPLLEILNRPEGSAGDESARLRARESFFHYIYGFDAPLGKYAIASPDDEDWDGLAQVMQTCGVTPLINQRVAVQRGGDTLWLAGICRESGSLNSAGNSFRKDDCVLAVAYGPEVLPVMLTSEAADGGQWADLALCGHTHGGQIRLFGRNALPLSDREERYLSGWFMENALPVLVNQGVGCEGVNLRLGSAPEVWMITLRGVRE